MRHTKGPWKVHYHSHINKEQWLSILHGAWDITHNGASNPAVIACSKYSAMGDEENLANARLIAKAPEMYDHLLYIEEVISMHCLAECGDDEYLDIVVTAKAAKDIVKTIVEVVMGGD